MTEIVVKIPDEFASEKSIFEKKMRIIIDSEIKQRKLIKLIDKIMESANQLNDEELIRLGDEFKEAGIKELRNKGILI